MSRMDSTLTVSTLVGVLSAPLNRDADFLSILAEKDGRHHVVPSAV